MPAILGYLDSQSKNAAAAVAELLSASNFHVLGDRPVAAGDVNLWPLDLEDGNCCLKAWRWRLDAKGPKVMDLGSIGFLRQHGRQAHTDERPIIYRGVVALFAEPEGFVVAADDGDELDDEVLLANAETISREV